MAYPNLKKDPALFKIKSKDDENKEFFRRSEKHEYEIILKSFKIDNDYYKKKYNNLNKRKYSCL